MTKLRSELKDVRKRNKVYQKLDQLLEANEYIKVEPDYFEDLSEFIKTNKRIKQESMVKVFSTSGRVLSLRPDITTNIMKQIIPYLTSDSVFKLFYNSTVFRQNKTSVLQTKQFGIEVFGDYPELEVIKLFNTIFDEFQLDFKLDIGNQVFVETLIETLFLPVELEKDLKKAIRSKNQKEIRTIVSTSDTVEKKILRDILLLNGTYEDVINQLSTYGLNKEDIQSIIRFGKDELPTNTAYDLSLLSEYDYYSGIVLQGYIENSNVPFLYGGRYDKLTKQYGKTVKAFGVSFDANLFVKECKI